MRTAWWALLGLASFALVTGFTALARSSAPTLPERIEAVAPAFASKKGASVDFHSLGQAVATASKGDRQGAALLLTLAIHESGLRESVRLDQYTDEQGDAYRDKSGAIQHRASGLWQVHVNSHNAAIWGSHDLNDQAAMAARIAAGALARCKNRAPYPINVFRAYAGRACDMPLKGEGQRAQTFQQVLRRL